LGVGLTSSCCCCCCAPLACLLSSLVCLLCSLACFARSFACVARLLALLCLRCLPLSSLTTHPARCGLGRRPCPLCQPVCSPQRQRCADTRLLARRCVLALSLLVVVERGQRCRHQGCAGQWLLAQRVHVCGKLQGMLPAVCPWLGLVCVPCCARRDLTHPCVPRACWVVVPAFRVWRGDHCLSRVAWRSQRKKDDAVSRSSSRRFTTGVVPDMSGGTGSAVTTTPPGAGAKAVPRRASRRLTGYSIGSARSRSSSVGPLMLQNAIPGRLQQQQPQQQQQQQQQQQSPMPPSVITSAHGRPNFGSPLRGGDSISPRSRRGGGGDATGGDQQQQQQQEAQSAEDLERAAQVADREFRRRVGAALRDQFAHLTPLTLAVQARQYDVVELLIRLGGTVLLLLLL